MTHLIFDNGRIWKQIEPVLHDEIFRTAAEVAVLAGVTLPAARETLRRQSYVGGVEMRYISRTRPARQVATYRRKRIRQEPS